MDYEIVIVGSGPSGSSTALHLAGVDPALASRVLILERHHHPRPKLCGGGVVRDAANLLVRLGLDIESIPHAVAPRVSMVYEGRGLCLDSSMRVFRREDLDEALARHAATVVDELREGTEVKRMRRVEGGWCLETTAGDLTARVVVGADGATGRVRKAIAPEDTASRVARVVEVFASDAGERQLPDDARFEFGGVTNHGIAGYIWRFPMLGDSGRHFNYGVFDTGLPSGTYGARPKPVLADFMAADGLDLSAGVKGHPIRLFHPAAVCSAPGVILVGDAVGTDPLFGEGIGPALGFGEVAARALVDAFEIGDLSFADYRQRVHGSPLGRSLAWRRRIARAVYARPSRLVQRGLWWFAAPGIAMAMRKGVFGWSQQGIATSG